jgi:hypothetical protein
MTATANTTGGDQGPAHVQARRRKPRGTYHFETGRPPAERLGYDPEVLDRIPADAIESFAGVGHFFDLAQLTAGVDIVCGAGDAGGLLPGERNRVGDVGDRAGPARLLALRERVGDDDQFLL